MEEKKVKTLDRFIKKFETTMAAAAFAEEGEADEARRTMREDLPAKTKGKGKSKAGRPVDMRLRPQSGH